MAVLALITKEMSLLYLCYIYQMNLKMFRQNSGILDILLEERFSRRFLSEITCFMQQ